jgi:N utilization substance protein A
LGISREEICYHKKWRELKIKKINNSEKNMAKIIKDSSSLGQFGSAIAQICKEKGLEKDRVLETVEAALAAAYKKDYGKKGQLIIARMDEVSGDVSFKQLKEVVDENSRNMEDIEETEFKKAEDGDFYKKAKISDETIEKTQSIVETEDKEAHLVKFNPEKDILLKEAKKIDKNVKVGDFIEIPLEAKSDYGRVASQTAKQVIIQRLREAERDAMYDEYKGKEGEIINGTVQRVEGRNVYIDLGRSVGALFPSGQIPGENYRIGQRIKLYIEKVESDPKGPGVVLSRTHPELIRKLFELEVPEIFSGTVEIKAIAREAGSRTKIAVSSKEEGLDPIGSCVGQKGTRVQAVIDEINGEKIDIIQWNDNVEKLISSALSPAKVVKVEIKEALKEAKAYVPADQISLAIGRSGQNVRLAVKLTGWKIDVLPINIEDDEDQEKEKEGRIEDEKPAEIKEEKKISEGVKNEGDNKSEEKNEKQEQDK